MKPVKMLLYLFLLLQFISFMFIVPKASCIEMGDFSWVDYMLDGNKFFEQKRYEKAVEKFKKAVGEKANLWDGWFQLAMSYEKLAGQDKSKTIFLYKEALSAYRRIPQSETLFFDKVRFHRMKISKIIYGSGGGAILEDEELEWVKSLKKANDAISSGKYDEAISLLRSVADAKPDLYEVYLSLGYAYEKKVEHVSSIHQKVNMMDRALSEYAKIPRKIPAFSKKIRSIQERMNLFYKKKYSFNIKLGQNRDDLISALGKIKSGQEKVSTSHYPYGSVTDVRYEDVGVYFKLREGKVFSIKFGSNYKGIIYRLSFCITGKQNPFLEV